MAAPREPLPARPRHASIVAAAAVLAARLAASIQPNPQGHFLTNSELNNVTTVACLQARQLNPGVKCYNETLVETPASLSFSGSLSAGNYPSYQDPMCRSNGEFFCDPSSVLTKDDRQNLTNELSTLRQFNPVTCGRLLDDPVDPRHYQPFYLGVALATNWPVEESDPDSLQQFGQIVAAQWNVDHLFVGSPQPYLRCPNTAVLVILPEIPRVFLSSASCEFICEARGGPEVVAATMEALHRHGLSAAIHAGIAQAYSAISHGQAARRGGGPSSSQREAQETLVASSLASVLVQRLLFGLAAVGLVLSLALGVVMLLLAPGWISGSRRHKLLDQRS